MQRCSATFLLLIVIAALLLSACPVHRGPHYGDGGMHNPPPRRGYGY